MDQIVGERWLPVAGWEGLYEVSDQGRVKSLARVVIMSNGVLRPVRERVLSPGDGGTGHMFVNLARHGRGKSHWVHRLVLTAFVGPPEDGQQCAHGDGNPKNNMLSNLRWATRVENAGDKRLHGTHPEGSNHGMAVLTEADVLAIRAEYKRESYHQSNTRELAARFGITYKNVLMIVSRRTWTHI